MTEKAKYKIKGRTTDQTLTAFTAQAIKDYGSEVIEQRAIPDYRDGLKPVQRYILWAMYKLGCHHNSGYKKSARVIGDVIGKYHPHGDQGTYKAMVNMAGIKTSDGKRWANRNCTTPLVEGYGNWGDLVSPAAAYRYSEARLSKFSDLVLLDPDYLAVIEKLPNFSNDEQVPMVLPAKLPAMLLNSSTSIAVGVSASSPSFSLDGVLKLTKLALQGKKITPKMCMKDLTFEYPYGGECVAEDQDIIEVVKGKGSIYFTPSMEIDDDKRTVTFTSACPGLMSSNTIETFLEKLASIKGAKSAEDESGKKGIRLVVTAQRNVDFGEFADKCYEIATRSERYDIGITLRQPEGNAKFKRVSIPDIFELWSKWRIELEIKVINRLIGIQQDKLTRQELILLAVDNLDIIIKALKVKAKDITVKINGEQKTIDASSHYLMKHLALTYDEANFILDMKVRQLRAMERNSILEAIKIIKAELKSLKGDLKQPEQRVLKDLNKLSGNLESELVILDS